MKLKSACLAVAMIISMTTFAQNNFLDTSTWTLGTGSVLGFNKNGDTSENVREMGINPHGENTVLWKAVPDAVSGPDGGWNGSYYDIDHTKTYRFTVWVKKTNSTNGTTYFGLYSRDAGGSHSTLKLDGTAKSNAYFWSGDLPQLDKWYLLVGFVHGSSYMGTSTTGGIYDGDTGVKVLNANLDFKFSTAAARLLHRTYLFYNTNTDNRQFFWGPTIYEVNNLEPTIQELIDGPNNNNNSGTSVWTENGDTASYDGFVAVGTTSVPAGYQLAVEGKVRAREMRVDQDTWPDYVFNKEYDLSSLKELKIHIQEKGHLPKIPSAKEVEAHGIELGEMNKLLLEKIEELTLHLIQLSEEVDQLKEDLN
ncbi:hypothetical protein [uncultured Croceitalea sp.]|uniref:hypothetical protein n=1 Tax=uncultured Croceitalea sp. TaxID=1798908 RepID=UPI003306063B